MRLWLGPGTWEARQGKLADGPNSSVALLNRPTISSRSCPIQDATMTPDTLLAPKRGQKCAIARPEMRAESEKKAGPLQLHMRIEHVGRRGVLVQKNGSLDAGVVLKRNGSARMLAGGWRREGPRWWVGRQGCK